MSKTAFVVEDEENIREVIKCALESCGLRVKGFEEAELLFEEMEKVLPDLILLDIMLPGMDGLSALRQIKAGPAAHVPVILLTAKSSEIDKVTGLDLGADDYVTKPFGVLELMARVRAALRHAGQAGSDRSVLIARGIRLDKERHEVTLHEKAVELTLKEFELLKLLMENEGKAMTRNILLDNVWGYGYAGETRTLDMHVRSLRQKLGIDETGGHYITTVRGVGYKFDS
ncbi:response regulator transcription factor [Ethanoligenens harbinense]|uniref:Sensory transduction protein RegX3 n=1 Tax=Ethanoligenens harbinense (strain DSM 18485 / JCM 12961 / CGMCC 1.5033 / YUAN-3) TaxID=663278 RepID=E6U7A1_ETHHY|nr:response regulator transcription factor [Ethanoligenens harbinense]ADU25836.1 two component transcriptional regulator, winged helix family [Ethanoligenens harbinense YUAN-3]AVQ94996.1 DNA-binding response regulator [Ethanoligenens harbinense YUAN-3]AYF37688.1 DNA-binding response regulator [Ethanoligenens harbinense]AYF40408.1 DNA-binding response regulator [Ethanoligenens harbinense]QCN91244.1 DNA-binding response regulator [Ethanoligenens harbinense]